MATSATSPDLPDGLHPGDVPVVLGGLQGEALVDGDPGEVLLTVAVVRTGSSVRLVLAGELDLATTSLLASEVAMAEVEGLHALDLDLTPLTFCDASGLHTVFAIHRDLTRRGVGVRVVGGDAFTRLVDVLGLHGTLGEALVAGSAVVPPARRPL